MWVVAAEFLTGDGTDQWYSCSNTLAIAMPSIPLAAREKKAQAGEVFE
jgi:hypothetical protein